ncbi:MAG: hypothetical protein LBH13_05360 [Cellulomonadaceae bacterium]|jgi:hypothetical protein|nr:hypothetical protein [Cellulomonadaceae bacterium]
MFFVMFLIGGPLLLGVALLAVFGVLGLLVGPVGAALDHIVDPSALANQDRERSEYDAQWRARVLRPDEPLPGIRYGSGD